MAALKIAQKELSIEMCKARRTFKERAEQDLANSNTKRLWDSIREMTNMKSERKPIFALDEGARANELNDFFMRFECDTSQGCHDVIDELNYDAINDRMVIDQDTVCKVFKNIQTNKATGPDGMHASLLKTCAEELAPAWQKLFQLSLDSHKVPELWKKSVIVPIPKKACPTENNDYRPVAITSNVVKSLERILTEELRKEVGPRLDQYQFAYSKNRSTCDAISTLAHLTLKHLEKQFTYARLLFVDFSSAFNTIRPDILLRKLAQLDVNPSVIKWYFSFLSERPQRVRFNSVLSEETLCSTGVPQGTVSSSLLFTLYTDDCVSSNPNQFVIKFSDDTVILSLLKSNSNIDSHTSGVDNFTEWCDQHHLRINVNKTQEIIVDPRSIGDHSMIAVHDHNIEQVSSYKYLGVQIDKDLSWHTHVTTLCSKIHQRLHFLRRLRLFGVSQNIMLTFYRASIESILRYGISSWFGNLTVVYKSQITRLVNMAGKIMGMATPPIRPQAIFEQAVMRQAENIVSDPSHVLNPEYDLLPSGRRYRTSKWGCNRYKHSFIPMSIQMLNLRLQGRL